MRQIIELFYALILVYDAEGCAITNIINHITSRKVAVYVMIFERPASILRMYYTKVQVHGIILVHGRVL